MQSEGITNTNRRNDRYIQKNMRYTVTVWRNGRYSQDVWQIHSGRIGDTFG